MKKQIVIASTVLSMVAGMTSLTANADIRRMS